MVASLLAILALGLAHPVNASPVNGRQVGLHSVAAYSSDRFEITFRGDEAGTVVVSGDGDTDLDLYIYDENGHLVDSDTDYTDDCVVRIHPRWTGPFTIVVRNLGPVSNVYAITAF